MVKMTGVYQGQKHCEITHEPSGSRLETDAPKDNFGKGERFSPTDLLAASLGSCVITTMAIQTEKDGLQLEGSQFEAEKIMSSSPRRVAQLNLRLKLPKSLTAADRARLESIAQSCPVKLSLSSEMKIEIHFDYCL